MKKVLGIGCLSLVVIVAALAAASFLFPSLFEPGTTRVTVGSSSFDVLQESLTTVQGQKGLLIEYRTASIEETGVLDRAAAELAHSLEAKAEAEGASAILVRATAVTERHGPLSKTASWDTVFTKGLSGWKQVP